MRVSLFLALSLLLSGCSALTPTPQAPPPPTTHAQEINRAQSYGLPKIGTISVQVRGSPDDAERAIAARANQLGATYYQILLIDETVMPAFWYASAVLYAASPGTGAQQ